MQRVTQRNRPAGKGWQLESIEPNVWARMEKTFSIGDLVTQLGQIVGRVEYVRASGWAGVRDASGRIDEYRSEHLRRAQ